MSYKAHGEVQTTCVDRTTKWIISVESQRKIAFWRPKDWDLTKLVWCSGEIGRGAHEACAKNVYEGLGTDGATFAGTNRTHKVKGLWKTPGRCYLWMGTPRRTEKWHGMPCLVFRPCEGFPHISLLLCRVSLSTYFCMKLGMSFRCWLLQNSRNQTKKMDVWTRDRVDYRKPGLVSKWSLVQYPRARMSIFFTKPFGRRMYNWSYYLFLLNADLRRRQHKKTRYFENRSVLCFISAMKHIYLLMSHPK